MSAYELEIDDFEAEFSDDETWDDESGDEEAALFLDPEEEFDSDPEMEFDLDEFETGMEDPELDQELRRRRSFSRSRGIRRSPALRRRSPARFRGRGSRPFGRRPRPRRPRRRPSFPGRPRFPGRRGCPDCHCQAQGTEYVRWVQSSLNRIAQLQLPVNGIMDPQARDALRDFQQRQGLIADGIAGPETQQALMGARAGRAAAPPSDRPNS